MKCRIEIKRCLHLPMDIHARFGCDGRSPTHLRREKKISISAIVSGFCLMPNGVCQSAGVEWVFFFLDWFSFGNVYFVIIRIEIELI